MTRHGFTLLEVVISSMLLSIVIGAASALLFITSRAVPTGDDPAIAAADTLRAMDLLSSELAFATSLEQTSPAAIQFTIRDRDADGLDDQITYTWAGAPGDPLVRQETGLGPEAITGGLQSLAIGYTLSADATRVLGAYLTAHSDRSRSSVLRTSVRLINRPAAP